MARTRRPDVLESWRPDRAGVGVVHLPLRLRPAARQVWLTSSRRGGAAAVRRLGRRRWTKVGSSGPTPRMIGRQAGPTAGGAGSVLWLRSMLALQAELRHHGEVYVLKDVAQGVTT